MNGASSTETVIQKILQLKKLQDALILAHTYQSLDVQDLADRVGDSLELSRHAARSKSKTIVFCGVRFMAETAKLLAPESTVLLPVSDAGCFMADMINVGQLENLKAMHPGAPVVAYVNSTAEIKAHSDICCTSANALSVVESLPGDEVIMLPDRNLARYVAGMTKKRIYWHDGFCPVHVRMKREEVADARKKHPQALLMAHPECEPEVLELADEIRSTSGMLRLVAERHDVREWIIATEATVVERLERDYPDRRFLNLGNAKYCLNMRKTRPGDVLNALETMSERIEIDSAIAEKARIPIQRMIEIG